jgi:hypothetical protein
MKVPEGYRIPPHWHPPRKYITDLSLGDPEEFERIGLGARILGMTRLRFVRMFGFRFRFRWSVFGLQREFLFECDRRTVLQAPIQVGNRRAEDLPVKLDNSLGCNKSETDPRPGCQTLAAFQKGAAFGDID